MGTENKSSTNKVAEFNRIVTKLENLEAKLGVVARKVVDGSKYRITKKRKRNKGSGSSSSSSLGIGRHVPLPREDWPHLEPRLLDLLTGEALHHNHNINRNHIQGASGLSNPLNLSSSSSLCPSLNLANASDFGVISSYTVLSPQGLKWIKSKSLNSETEIEHLSQCYTAATASHSSIDKYYSVPTSLKELPDDSILEKLLGIYSSSTLPLLAVISVEEIYGIFQAYQKQGLMSLRPSYILLLNSILALATNIQQQILKGHLKGFHAADLQDHQMLRDLEDTFISNSLYYYLKVSVIGDGILSLQGILSLITYNDFSGAFHNSFMMVSSAIRLAQDLGLHSEVTFEGLSKEEAQKRRKVWWLCLFFDQRLAVVLGRPPVVAEYDMTTRFPEANKKLKLLDQVTLGSSTTAKDYDEDFAQEMFDIVLRSEGFVTLSAHYINKLSKMTGRIYMQLYSASIINGSVEQVKIINKLLDDLSTFKLSIPKTLRPGNTVQLPMMLMNEVPKEVKCFLISQIHLNYYVGVMLVQRALFKVETLLKKSGACDSTPAYDSVNAARDMLNLTRQLGKANLGGFLSSTKWPFILAFFDIFVYTLSKQEDSVTYESDIRLMICCYDHLLLVSGFSVPLNPLSAETSAHNGAFRIDNTLFYFKCMINILRNTFESKFGRKIILGEQDEKYLVHKAYQYPKFGDVEFLENPRNNPFANSSTMNSIDFEGNPNGIGSYFHKG